MKKRRIISLFLCLTMLCALVLTACGTSKESEESEESAETESTEDMYTVKILAYGDGTTEAEQEISEAISEITREKIGVNVEITKGYTADELNLMLTSGEPMDIFPAMSWEVNFASIVNQGLVCPITDLLDEYAPETKASISDADWACVTINGEIYGIPMNKEKASSSGICVRSDVVEELGIDLDTIKTFDDVEEMLMLVKENTDYYPMGSDAGNLVNILPCDDLGDGLGVLENIFDDDLTVVDWYETDSYRDLVYMMYDWNQKGLIMPDATSNTEPSTSVLAANVFSVFANFKPGVERQASNEAGIDLTCVDLYGATSATGSVCLPYCIAASSEQPEKAMQVLELLYTDPEVANLFTNGIEGKYWVYVDEENDVIDYPEGEDMTTTGWSTYSWASPNQLITSIRKGDEVTLWDDLQEFNANAHDSAAKGFMWDNSKVMNEVTACQNVIEKYSQGLELGVLNPDETLDVFIQELKDAGIDTIVAEKQAQLDEWAKQQ